MTRTRATLPRRSRGLTVSRPHDAAERQAEKAADVVARGGSVTSWSFASVSARAAVHRDEKKPAGKSTGDKLEEAGKKVVEATLKTDTGKQIVKKVEDSEPVKALRKAAESTPGKIVGGTALAGAIAGQIAAGKNLPFSLPDIPLGKGWSIKPQIDTPITHERHPGITLTFHEQGGGGKQTDSKGRIAAETAALRRSLAMFKSEQQKRQEKADEQAAIAALLAAEARRFAVKPVIPLAPGETPKAIEFPKTDTTDEPAKSEEKTGAIQREPSSEAGPRDRADVAVAHDTSGIEAAVQGGGRPLEPALRHSLEARFGYDFGSVRIHDDSQANAAADRLQANAFTRGSDVVFAHGRYAPSTPQGRRLLAHELVHVVQQRGTVDTTHIHRRSGWDTFLVWLGVDEGTWSDRELHAYLDSITGRGEIDGSYDADNKARAIVRKWKSGSPGYNLLGQQKTLLIKEMLDGPTLNEDEQAILDLLERSDAGDLRTIFGSAGITINNLDSDFQGAEQDRLDAFVATRFRGGRAALQAGRVEVMGDPVPAGAPAYGFDATILDAWFDSDRTPAELIALLDRFSPADRERALHHLSQVRRPRMLGEERNIIEQFDAETDPTRRQQLRDDVIHRRADRLRTERVLLHYFHGEIPATAADLRSGTTPADPARRTELQEALRPQRSPTVTSFTSQLPGESENYQTKIRRLLPGMVNAYYTKLVTKRPPRTHTLAEFEAIGNVSKRETDAVFGQFYSATAHPAFVADTQTPRRRGNLHDAFAETERELRRMSAPQRRRSAKTLLFYFFQSNSKIRRINRAHGASPRFDNRGRPANQVARILDLIANDFTATPTNVRRLNEIDRGWDASARGREVYVQLFQPSDTRQDRLLLWDMFQTLIHEYMHTLARREYNDYAESFGDRSNEYNTLIEGADCVLSEIVWEHVAPRLHAVRKDVEGPTYAALPAIDVPHPSMRRYPSYTEALRLVDLVGIQALYAAYFLGLVDRIGGPAPRGRRP